MDVRKLTVTQIAAYLDRPRRPPAPVLRALGRDPRMSVRSLLARYYAVLAAERAELARLRSLYREERRRARFGEVVAGIDEVGRGPLAGPVVAAAVILGPGAMIPGLNDSKRLLPCERERLDHAIRTRAVEVCLAEASVEEIDRLNILGATRLAMRRAIEQLTLPPHFVLIDGRDDQYVARRYAPIIAGDASCACIAAASIVAKVYRDRLMMDLDQAYPMYGFVRHKGYATREHLAALSVYGASPVHRRSFLPARQLVLFDE